MSGHNPIARLLMPVAAGCTASLLVAVTSASAESVASSGLSQVAQTSIDCTIYGSGYVVVQGTTRCVRIRGRMRVHQPTDGYRGANYLPYAGASGARLPANLRPGPAQRRWTH